MEEFLKKSFEFRIADDKKDWENIKPVTYRFCKWEEAAAKAKELSKDLKREVRVNYTGSYQGRYFLEK